MYNYCIACVEFAYEGPHKVLKSLVLDSFKSILQCVMKGNVYACVRCVCVRALYVFACACVIVSVFRTRVTGQEKVPALEIRVPLAGQQTAIRFQWV